MKCPKCGFDYEDTFKFCPNCSETNPLTVQPPVATEPPPVEPPKEKKPKKKLSERVKPVFAKVKEKTNKKTIIIGAVILVVVIAAIVVPIVLTRPSYPDEISLGKFEEGDLTIDNLTLKKGEEAKTYYSYELTGTAKAKWNGNAKINLSLTTAKGPEKEKHEFAVQRNENQKIKESVLASAPVSKCTVSSVEYDGKMSADAFVSIDNISDGQTLTIGPNAIAGTVSEDCTVTFNGQPVQVGEDKKFSVTADISEGPNTLSFEVDADGEKATKTLSITGELTPEQYKASCPAGPPFANLNKNPNSFKGQRCQYRGKVVQVMESGGTGIIRMDVTPGSYGYWTDTVYVTYAGTTPAVEDSIIVVYGTIGGSHTYESQAGYQITLPLIEAKYIDVQ